MNYESFEFLQIFTFQILRNQMFKFFSNELSVSIKIQVSQINWSFTLTLHDIRAQRVTGLVMYLILNK